MKYEYSLTLDCLHTPPWASCENSVDHFSSQLKVILLDLLQMFPHNIDKSTVHLVTILSIMLFLKLTDRQTDRHKLCVVLDYLQFLIVPPFLVLLEHSMMSCCFEFFDIVSLLSYFLRIYLAHQGIGLKNLWIQTKQIHQTSRKCQLLTQTC